MTQEFQCSQKNMKFRSINLDYRVNLLALRSKTIYNEQYYTS